MSGATSKDRGTTVVVTTADRHGRVGGCQALQQVKDESAPGRPLCHSTSMYTTRMSACRRCAFANSPAGRSVRAADQKNCCSKTENVSSWHDLARRPPAAIH
jgi:hypothetical protein